MAKTTPMKAIRRKCLHYSTGSTGKWPAARSRIALYMPIGAVTDLKRKIPPLRVVLMRNSGLGA